MSSNAVTISRQVESNTLMSIGCTRRTTNGSLCIQTRKDGTPLLTAIVFLLTTTLNLASVNMKPIEVTQTTNFFTVALEKKRCKQRTNWTSNRTCANESGSHETSEMLFPRRELTRHQVWHLKIASRNVLGASR